MYLYYSNNVWKILTIIILINVVYSKNNRKRNNCGKSITTMNGVKVMCKNELIFEENFDQITGDEFADEDNYRYLNSSIWKREIKIPLDPVK